MTHHSRIGFLSLVRVAAVLLALLTCGSEASAQRLKVILDTDIGGDIDDAWALGFAMQSPDIDLLGVTIRPADEFPTDDSGYGFDNIGDVLSISPLLSEKLMSAAARMPSSS